MVDAAVIINPLNGRLEHRRSAGIDAALVERGNEVLPQEEHIIARGANDAERVGAEVGCTGVLDIDQSVRFAVADDVDRHGISCFATVDVNAVAH